MKPLKLGHVHLKVRDLARSTKFYTELLGLRVEEQVGNYAFLTDGVLHHVIALQALGSQAAPPAVRSIGLYHVAFEVASSSELSTVLQLLNSGGSSTPSWTTGSPLRPISKIPMATAWRST